MENNVTMIGSASCDKIQTEYVFNPDEQCVTNGMCEFVYCGSMKWSDVASRPHFEN